MATEFARRYLEVLKKSPYIQSVARPGLDIINIEYYVYNGVVGSAAVPLAVGVPQTAVIQTQSDSDFVLTFLSAAVQETANNTINYNDNVALQIQDTSTGKLFFSQATVVGLVSGAGGFPFVLPAPRVVAPNTSLLVTATNRDAVVNGGAGPVGLFFAFHGTRIYYG